MRQTGRQPSPRGPKARDQSRAFTLIEMLVVISIIGLLAALTLGVTGIAARSMKESRMRGELNQLVTKIESYDAALGFYPPDNPANPGTNQLYYELSGAVFRGGNPPRFQIVNSSETVISPLLKSAFHADGVANSSRDPRNVKYRTAFKPDQHRTVALAAGNIELLTVPLEGPNGSKAPNPWFYLAKPHATNNPSSFDLWVDVKIGKQLLRFCNWSKSPVLLQ